MTVEIYRRKNNPIRVLHLKKSLEALMKLSKSDNAFLEINLVGEKKITALNSQYRNKSSSTDVLSFPQDSKPPFHGGPWHMGEIFIATSVARRQAKAAGRSLTQQAIRLAVHGLVHLQGLDHEKGSKELKKFEAMEKKYLKYLKKKGLFQWDGLLQF